MKPFQCDICQEGLDSRRQGFKHLGRVHGGSGSVSSSSGNKDRQQSGSPSPEYILPDTGDIKKEVIESDSTYNLAGEERLDSNSAPYNSDSDPVDSGIVPIGSTDYLRDNSESKDTTSSHQVSSQNDLRRLSNKNKLLKLREKYIITSTNRHKCKDCSSEFSSYSGFYRHYRTVHLKHHKFTCNGCNANFISNSKLRQHQQNWCNPLRKQVVNGDSVFIVSNTVDLNFYHKKISQLSLEGKFVTNPTTDWSTCMECQKKFNCELRFYKHYKIVHLKLGLKCSVCGRILMTIRGFDEHQVAHHGKARFKCSDPACPQLFELESSVWKHRYSCHQSESPLVILPPRKPAMVANYCSLIPGTRRYECNLCKRTFTSKDGVRAHYKLIHRRVNYKCVPCCQEFPNKMLYNRHHLIVHLLAGNRCKQCGEPFQQKLILEKHIRLGRCKAGKLDE